MFILRPIREDELSELEKLANTSQIGVTNLPKDPGLLKQKIYWSLKSFKKEVYEPKHELYMFLLEDLENQKICGTCGIFSKTAVRMPAYYFKRETITPKGPLEHFKEIEVLMPVSYSNGPSEICGLYLLPEYRKSGIGKLLSLSRFLFIANFPKRFDHSVIAELRGYSDKNFKSPFWEAVGKKLCKMSYEDALALLSRGREFIPNLLPKYPIYIPLLPKKAQEVIGKTHPNTVPAYKMLVEEGFFDTKEVDIFDAGPKLRAQTKKIKTIKESHLTKVANVLDNIEGSLSLISNTTLDFKAVQSTIKIHEDQSISIDRKTAQALEIQEGEKVRYHLLKDRHE